MPRYIDVEDFIKEQCNSCDGYCEKVECDCLSCDKPYQCDMIQDLKAAPTISPDEVRGVGKWIEDGEQNHVELTFHCSECGRKAVGRFEKTRYCGNCGAKMEGADDGT